MTSRVPDPSKAREAQDEYTKGSKALATSTFKWKPDYLAAEPHFKAAARAFKAAGLYDQALEATRKSAHCSVKMGNLKQAAVSLEAAAREWTVLPLPGNAGKELAAELYNEVSGLLLEAGELVRAVDVKLNAGKLLEGFNREKAAAIYDEAAGMFEGVDDKDVYAVAPLSKVLKEQLSVGKLASAMRTLEKLIKLYSRLNQPHNVHKAILARVVLLLSSGDPVAAQREFEKALDVPGFAASPEAGAAEDMVGCYTEMNADALKSVTDRNVINYLDPPVAKLAKALHKALAGGGNAVGHATPQESASRAVRAEGSNALDGDDAGGEAGPGGLRAFGGKASSVGGGYLGTGATISGATAAAAGDVDAARSRKKQDAEATARASLFSRPAGGGGGGGGSARGTPKATSASPPPPAADDGGDEGPVFGAGGDEYDYSKAFSELGVGEGGDDSNDAGGGGAPAPAPASRSSGSSSRRAAAAAASADADEDDAPVRHSSGSRKKKAAAAPAPAPVAGGYGDDDDDAYGRAAAAPAPAPAAAAPAEDDDELDLR